MRAIILASALLVSANVFAATSPIDYSVYRLWESSFRYERFPKPHSYAASPQFNGPGLKAMKSAGFDPNTLPECAAFMAEMAKLDTDKTKDTPTKFAALRAAFEKAVQPYLASVIFDPTLIP